jgi:hypothetical protein
MNSNRPAWLKRNENGILAEARTKAFLLDRFWILERSVDIEGADLIIQRRSKRALLDPKPQRLGIVQVKYFQDRFTTQRVPRDYVIDPEGAAHDEFFLICHTGVADESQMFFLCAKDIQNHFPVDDRKRYVLPGSQVFNARWEVTSKLRRLSQMEQALINADFASNRRFLSWVLPNEVDESIAPEYVEEIDAWEGGHRQAFFKLRQQAEKEAWELNERLDLLAGIANTYDPLVAVEKACKLAHLDERRDGFYNEDLHRSLLREKEWYERLSNAGLLDAYASLRSTLRQKIIDDCVEKFPFGTNDIYFVEIGFGIHSLKLLSFKTLIHDRLTTPLKPYNSCYDHTMGVEEEVTTGIVNGFIIWSAFGSNLWISQGRDPCEQITTWVESLLKYVMHDILDQWRYQISVNK